METRIQIVNWKQELQDDNFNENKNSDSTLETRTPWLHKTKYICSRIAILLETRIQEIIEQSL